MKQSAINRVDWRWKKKRGNYFYMEKVLNIYHIKEIYSYLQECGDFKKQPIC